MFELGHTSEQTNARRFANLMRTVHASDRVTASAWFEQIETKFVASSNVEAQELPFQRWYRFKEAFSPRFVSTAIASLSKRPNVCVDPFGGSGTTSLTCQFLGVKPATIEVNPFLADLIEAKLHKYDVRSLTNDYVRLESIVKEFKGRTSHLLEGAPPTFVEPGVNGRWIFDKSIARRLLVFREAIGSLAKLARINSTPYLRHCYEKLKKGTGSFFVYGHSAAPNDAHIYNALFASEIDHIYFCIHRPTANIDQIDGELARYKSINRSDIDYTFVDAETVQIWDGTPGT